MVICEACIKVYKELCLRRNNSEEFSLVAYSDADWAGDTTERRSTTGYCVSL